MNRTLNLNRRLGTTLVFLGVLAAAPAHATPQAFSAAWQGTSQIVEVIDPGAPVVRFQTTALGSGSFDLVAYASEDIVDMATGAGTGSNVFTAANGDQLFGSFSVQIVPTAVPGGVDLFGHTTFTGGTGLFAGASGSADFTGSALFSSPTEADATLNFSGSVAVVPEPGRMALMALGLAALWPWARRRAQASAT
jgi:hypothetical protein